MLTSALARLAFKLQMKLETNSIFGVILPRIVAFSSVERMQIFETFIKAMALRLGEIQHWDNPLTENTILLGNFPGPKSDDYIREKKEQLDSENKKPIEHNKALLYNSILSIPIGAMTGFISALMIQYGNQDINPFGKGVLAFIIQAALYTNLLKN